VTGCPNLLFVQLGIDESVDIHWVERLEFSAANTGIRHLIVGRSPIYDVLAVATFLSRVFPRLISIIARGQARSGWKEATLRMSEHLVKKRDETALSACAGGNVESTMDVRLPISHESL